MTGSGQYCDRWNSDAGGLAVLQSHAHWQQLHSQSNHLDGAFSHVTLLDSRDL
jgi:hypothetical protein